MIIIQKIHNGWHFCQDSNPFSLILDDILISLSGDKAAKHRRPLSQNERVWLKDVTKSLCQLYINNEPFHDPLGDIYMELASKGGKKMLGQFFTPFHLCQLLTKVTFDSKEIAERFQKSGQLTGINDPACGSGRTVLSILNEIYMNDHELLKYIIVDITDLDIVSVKMAADNFAAANVIHGAGVGWLKLFHGDSLTLKKRLYFEGISQNHEVRKAIQRDYNYPTEKNVA